MHFFHETPQKNTDEAAPGRRRKRAHEPALPTSIPVVLADARPDGRLTVTVDGELFTPEPIGRAAFGSLLDEIIRKRGTALRVQVREPDGTTYTDLLTPPAHVDPAPPTPAPAMRDVDTAAGSALLEVTGDGFVPGEEVAFAPIFIHSSARADGSVRSLVEFDGPVTELLVFGRISGTAHVVRPCS